MQIPIPAPAHVDSSTKQANEFFGNANFLVVKLTDYCNLACTYCHQDALTGKPVLMPLETFKNAVRLILKPTKTKRVYIQFHGGEPLLQTEEFFTEAVKWSKKELEVDGRTVEFVMQTNLTRVDEKKRRFLRDLNIGFGFSIDGPPEINDKMRGGSRKIEENWRNIKKQNDNAGVICLIQPENWDRMEEVVDYFEKEGMWNARFNLMVPDGRGDDCERTTADKLYNAKKYILDYMIETNGRKVTDLTLHTAMKRFAKANGAPATVEYHGCESFYCQAARGLFSVNPDGKFYACDRIAENPSWAMGNVNLPFLEKELSWASKKRGAFHHKDDWWARCENCDARKICDFSCSAYYVDKVDTREVECQYTKLLYQHMVNNKELVYEYVRTSREPKQGEDVDQAAQQSIELQEMEAIKADAFYNSLTATDTLAMNKKYQLIKKGERYFIYIYSRDKLYEVDEMVAEIAKFNGCVPPQFIQMALSNQFPAGKLKEVIGSIQVSIPEILVGFTLPAQSQGVSNAVSARS